MEALKLTSPKLLWQPIPSTSTCRIRPGCSVMACARREANNGRSNHHGGRFVDENMITLRMRIKELKMSETEEGGPPSNWMEWEKRYYPHYNEDVLGAIGLLQSYLMSVRPGLALGMVAIVALSVPISTGVALFQSLEIAKTILSWIF